MLTCIVVEPEIEANLGFLARTMANFDVDQLKIVNPQFTIGEEARNTAVSAQDILNDIKIASSIEEALDDVDIAIGTTAHSSSSSNVLRNAIEPEEMAERASNVEGNIGIVLGRESKGLTNNELDHCDFIVTIPTTEKYSVMNITHAASILFYEYFRHQKDGEKPKASSRREKEALENIFKTILTTLDYTDAEEERILRCIKNFLGRSFLHEKEAHTLIGFFKNVQNNIGD